MKMFKKWHERPLRIAWLRRLERAIIGDAYQQANGFMVGDRIIAVSRFLRKWHHKMGTKGKISWSGTVSWRGGDKFRFYGMPEHDCFDVTSLDISFQ